MDSVFDSNDVEKHKWSLPPEPQYSSRLLSLPAELRTKILRFLLKKGSPLEPRRLPNREDVEHGRFLPAYEESYEAEMLSSRALRASQQLWQEGVKILYEENELVICVHREPYNIGFVGWGFYMGCRIMDIYVRISTKLLGQSWGEVVVYDRVEDEARSDEAGGTNKTIRSTKSILRECSIIKCFRRVVIKLQLFDQTAIFTTCLALQPLLQEANVSVYLEGTGREQRKSKEGKGLQSFKLLRTKSIAFPEEPEIEVKDIAQTVTSGSPVACLLAPYLDMRHNVLWSIMEMRSIVAERFERECYSEDMENEIKKFKNAMLSLDSSAFCDARRRLLEVAGPVTEVAAKATEEELRELYDYREKRLRDEHDDEVRGLGEEYDKEVEKERQKCEDGIEKTQETKDKILEAIEELREKKYESGAVEKSKG